MEPRGITKEQAASHCGVCVATFDLWRIKGIVPGPIPGTKRYDLKALDLALDKASGIEQHSGPVDAYEAWKNGHKVAAR